MTMFGLAAAGLLVVLAGIGLAMAIAQQKYLRLVRSHEADQRSFFEQVIDKPTDIIAIAVRRTSFALDAYGTPQRDVTAERARRRANFLSVLCVVCLFIGMIGLLFVAAR